MKLTPRLRNIISGLCALVLLSSVTTIGIKYAFGYYDPGMELIATFDSAGQGLIQLSDIKMRGTNVGHVQSIDLVDGRARVVLFIDEGTDIPRSTVAVIRPKTLFGEKFIDLVPGYLEGSGSEDDLYADGEAIDDCTPEDITGALGGDSDEATGCTIGAVELERVLADLYPILQAVDPQSLATILDELATGADGTGELVNRTLENSAELLDVQASNNANTAQFLEDLALLSEELADRAPDLIGGAQDLNVALPVLTENAASFNALLVQLERLSTTAAELLEGNTAFIDAVYTDGQRTLDTLFANREQLIPLVVGLGSYLDILGSLGHIPVGDGSFMAAVKGVLGGQVCTLPIPICGSGVAATGAEAPADVPLAAEPGVEVAPSPPSLDEALETTTDGLVTMLADLLGGRR
jgi:phospholipid/cholesterol/gamma-HCH transport system substrate-binding protein